MPNYALVITNMAECYKQMGQVRNRTTFDLSEEKSSHYRYRICDNSTSLVQGDEAIKYFKRSLDVDPKLMRTYSLFSQCLYQLGNFRGALAVVKVSCRS